MDDRKQAAQVEQDIRMLVELIGRPASKLHQQYPDDQVCLAIRELIGSDESLKSGEIVCRVLRLPLPWQHTLLECLNGTDPYTSSETRPDGVVVVRNDGASLNYLARHNRMVPYNPITGRQEPERTTFHEVRNVWPGGETKILPLGTAIRLLQTHSYQAVPPLARMNQNIDPRLLPLCETGYQLRMFDPESGEMMTYTSADFEKQKAA